MVRPFKRTQCSNRNIVQVQSLSVSEMSLVSDILILYYIGLAEMEIYFDFVANHNSLLSLFIYFSLKTSLFPSKRLVSAIAVSHAGLRIFGPASLIHGSRSQG